MLFQDRDNGIVTREQLKCVTKREPTEQEIRDCLFAWTVHAVKSNAIVYAKDRVTALALGQMNRRDSAHLRLQGERAAETHGWAEPRTVAPLSHPTRSSHLPTDCLRCRSGSDGRNPAGRFNPR